MIIQQLSGFFVVCAQKKHLLNKYRARKIRLIAEAATRKIIKWDDDNQQHQQQWWVIYRAELAKAIAFFPTPTLPTAIAP